MHRARLWSCTWQWRWAEKVKAEGRRWKRKCSRGTGSRGRQMAFGGARSQMEIRKEGWQEMHHMQWSGQRSGSSKTQKLGTPPQYLPDARRRLARGKRRPRFTCFTPNRWSPPTEGACVAPEPRDPHSAAERPEQFQISAKVECLGS